MDFSRPLLQRFAAMTLAFALVGLSAACDSGTPEPDAPETTGGEYGAIPTKPLDAEPADRTPVEIPSDGSIPAERFPTELPEGVTAEVPTNFPSNIPMYPGAQPAQGRGVDRPDGSGIGGVQFVTNDSPGQVFDFYEKELTDAGWNITRSRNDGTVAALSVENGGVQAELFMSPSPLGGTDMFVVFEGK